MENRVEEKQIGKLADGLYWILVAALVLAGGYFEIISAVLTVGLLVISMILIWRKKGFRIGKGWNTIAITVVCIGYLVVSLWAVDRGTAVLGFVKFIPFLLYYLILGQIGEGRERIIHRLPLTGVLITVFTGVMSFFPIFESLVTVSGRLAGTFQYPNTFAAFLLICLIVLAWEEKKDWLSLIYAVILFGGIYMSGSRAVLILTFLTIVAMLILNPSVRKVTGIFLGIGIAAGIVYLVIRSGQLGGGLAQLMNPSTFLGRLLYYRDALPVILHHPFGLGYYGYYFLEPGIQTGVYSVVNVHNEWLQVMLDLGIIPGILVAIMVVRSVVCKGQTMRNRMVLIIMVLHALFDYDFQFVAMLFVLLLFLKEDESMDITYGMITRLTGSALTVALTVVSIFAGGASVCYIMGDYARAVKWWPGYTMAQVNLLTQCESAEDLREQAEQIIERNPDIAAAYNALAEAAFADSDVENYIRYKLEAIRRAPYQYEYYTDYIDKLSFAALKYLDAGDRASAVICIRRIERVPDMLEEVRDKTSPLAWKIRDIPTVDLSEEYLNQIQELEGLINE